MRLWYRFCRLLCQATFLIVFRGRVFGHRRVPRQGGVLLACNHQSLLDPVLATQALARECAYMARDTLFRHPIFRRLIESLNAFPIKRGSADISAVKETLRRLKLGQLITAFPEATRTLDGSLQPMQPGSVLIARRARVPLVPTLILGAFEAWPRDSKLPRPFSPVIVAHAEPIPPARLDALSDEECIALVQREIAEMMARYRGHSLLRGRLRRAASAAAPPPRALDLRPASAKLPA